MNPTSSMETPSTVRGSLVTPAGIVTDGVLEVAGDQITGVREAAPSDTVTTHRAAWVVPGFVDIHVHGGGSHTFTSGDVVSAREVARFHLSHGTTTMLASLVTAPL